MTFSFNKNDTKLIKGLAVLLMLLHHVWAFPDRIPNGSLMYSSISFLGMEPLLYIGKFGKICVSLFFFLGGYGLYIASENTNFSLFSRLKGLYKSRWKVMAVFIPIAFIFFSNQGDYSTNSTCFHNYDNFNWSELIANICGLSDSYNLEWWFFKSYVAALITFPLIKKIIRRFSVYGNIILMVIGCLLITNIFPYLGNFAGLSNNFIYKTFLCPSAPYTSCFWIGMLFARYNLLNRCGQFLIDNKMLNPVADVLAIFIITYVRNIGIGEISDLFTVPFFIIFSLDILRRIKLIKKIFLGLGRKSTNMWLIHSFFCYYFGKIAILISATNIGAVTALILVIVTYLASVLLDLMWKGIGNGVNIVGKFVKKVSVSKSD